MKMYWFADLKMDEVAVFFLLFVEKLDMSEL